MVAIIGYLEGPLRLYARCPGQDSEVVLEPFNANTYDREVFTAFLALGTAYRTIPNADVRATGKMRDTETLGRLIQDEYWVLRQRWERRMKTFPDDTEVPSLPQYRRVVQSLIEEQWRRLSQDSEFKEMCLHIRAELLAKTVIGGAKLKSIAQSASARFPSVEPTLVGRLSYDPFALTGKFAETSMLKRRRRLA